MQTRQLDAKWWAGLELVLVGGYNVRKVAELDRCTILVCTAFRDDPTNSYAYWSICDNGGELNVEKVNHGETLRSVAYVHDRSGPVDPGTMAYRVAMVIDGKQIDYAQTGADLVELLKAGA